MEINEFKLLKVLKNELKVGWQEFLKSRDINSPYFNAIQILSLINKKLEDQIVDELIRQSLRISGKCVIPSDYNRHVEAVIRILDEYSNKIVEESMYSSDKEDIEDNDTNENDEDTYLYTKRSEILPINTEVEGSCTSNYSQISSRRICGGGRGRC